MDIASGRTDQEEDLAGGLEGYLADGHVPVVGHRTGRKKLVAGKGIESWDKSGRVGILSC